MEFQDLLAHSGFLPKYQDDQAFARRCQNQNGLLCKYNPVIWVLGYVPARASRLFSFGSNMQ